MFFVSSATLLAAALAAALGPLGVHTLPTTGTPTSNSGLASRTVPKTGVTHSVVAGRGGALLFDPENVVAAAGDVIEWHFLPKNHSVAQSSFANPCQPLTGDTGFFSGFQPVTDGQNQNPDVFQLVVEDASKPLWYYCAQTKGNHCQNGMAGVINQNFDSPNTLAAYKAAAAGTSVSLVPPTVQGGAVIPNPNPLGGF